MTIDFPESDLQTETVFELSAYINERVRLSAA